MAMDNVRNSGASADLPALRIANRVGLVLDMSGYDAFYQKLITNFDLATVTGFFSMEAIIDNRPVDLTRLR